MVPTRTAEIKDRKICGLDVAPVVEAIPDSFMIGKGGFGDVFLVKEGKVSVALKTVNYDDSPSLPEIIFGRAFEHPYLLKTLNIYKAPECQPSSIIGYTFPLGQHDLTIPTTPNKKIFFQILSAINEMHENNILHGDIKPSNVILFEDGNVKVSDFGLSRSLNGNQKYIVTGFTPFFAAPEYFSSDQMIRQTITLPADIWAIGLTFISIVTPQIFNLFAYRFDESFDRNNPRKIYDFLNDENFLVQIIVDCAKQLPVKDQNNFAALLAGALQPQAIKRSTAKQLLKSPYFDEFKEPILTPLKAPVLIRMTPKQKELYLQIIELLVSPKYLSLEPGYWFGIVDLLYFTILYTKLTDSLQILQVAILIAFDIYGKNEKLDYSTSRNVWQEKKNIIFACSGIIYRKTFFDRATSLAEAVSCFRIVQNPDNYVNESSRLAEEKSFLERTSKKYGNINKSEIKDMFPIAKGYLEILDESLYNGIEKYIINKI